MEEIKGVRRSETMAVTTVLKAAPMITPTARSTTLPLSKNCLNSLSMNLLFILRQFV